MLVTNLKRKGRTARIIAEREDIVLYDALEDGKVINPNMVRPANKFWSEYGV